MPEFWTPSPKSKYYLPRRVYMTVRNYCLNYESWVKEYRDSVGLRNVTSGSGSGGIGDPTASQAMRLKSISDRIELIEQTAYEVEPSLHPYLLYGVTREHMTYEKLQAKQIPCERKMYYDRRRKFYYLMAQRLHL